MFYQFYLMFFFSLLSQGFRFKKTNGNRQILCERADLQAARCAYLRKIKKVREDKTYEVVYIDETAINAHHTLPKEWISEDGTLGRKIPTGKKSVM